jgi:hypothetical protein
MKIHCTYNLAKELRGVKTHMLLHQHQLYPFLSSLLPTFNFLIFLYCCSIKYNYFLFFVVKIIICKCKELGRIPRKRYKREKLVRTFFQAKIGQEKKLQAKI